MLVVGNMFRAFSAELGTMRRSGLKKYAQAWAHEHLIVPAKELTYRQLVVSASVGLWGGVSPIFGTSVWTGAAIFMYSLGVPKRQRFNVPMAGVAMVMNEIALPLNLALLPGFMLSGTFCYNMAANEKIDCPIDKDAIQVMRDKPREFLGRFGFCYGLGCGMWAALTPLVLGKIRMVGAAAKLATAHYK
mmetsp:Transcript_24072/g.44318  ORF Transcript_24072/g.44318 Transcript_24072/m.44318 type:complete len:189 (-) Transcript_24072:23-589(-)